MSASVSGWRGICARECKSGNGVWGECAFRGQASQGQDQGDRTSRSGAGRRTVGGINVVCPLQPYVFSRTNGPIS